MNAQLKFVLDTVLFKHDIKVHKYEDGWVFSIMVGDNRVVVHGRIPYSEEQAYADALAFVHNIPLEADTQPHD